MKNVYDEGFVNLRCIAAGFGYDISATGIPKQEAQMKAVIGGIE